MPKELSKPMLAVLCEDYPKIKTVINANEIEGLMNYLIRILNIKISNKQEQDDLDFQMPVILDFIKSKFGFFTIPEIKEAFKMYVAREFPQIKVFRMLDCAVISEVLLAYQNYRADVLRGYERKKQMLLDQAIEKVEVSEFEKQKSRNDFLLAVFNDLKTRGYSHDLWLEWEDQNKNLTPFALKVNAGMTLEQKKEMYDREEKLYLLQLKSKSIGNRNVSAKWAVENALKQINSNQKINEVVKRCRNLAASNYLKKYLTDFETFKNEIDDGI